MELNVFHNMEKPTKIWSVEFVDYKVIFHQGGKTLTIPTNQIGKKVFDAVYSGHTCGGCIDLPTHGYDGPKSSWCWVSRAIANKYNEGIKWTDRQIGKYVTLPLGTNGDNYIYAYSYGDTYPAIVGVDELWYTLPGQLEFFKLSDSTTLIPEDGWYVEPCWYGAGPNKDEMRRFAGFNMTGLEVLKLWTYIVEHGGEVSDGVVNLF
jgi:hypothetical protein